MEEKVLVKSEQYSMKIFITTVVVIGLIFIAVFALRGNAEIVERQEYYQTQFSTYQKHQRENGYSCGGSLCKACSFIQKYPSSNAYTKQFANQSATYWSIGFAIAGCLAIFSLVVYLWLHSYEMIVTDKRVYGRVAWGKRVDLPVDSISATGMIGLLKGVSVSTSSGRVGFLLIKNASQVYGVVNELVIKRQNDNRLATSAVITQSYKQSSTPNSSSADELLKFKNLLDQGIISQEEFDAKKKQLLGL